MTRDRSLSEDKDSSSRRKKRRLPLEVSKSLARGLRQRADEVEICRYRYFRLPGEGTWHERERGKKGVNAQLTCFRIPHSRLSTP